MATGATIVADLPRMLRADQVLTDPASLDAYAHDDAEWAPYEPPLAVVLAEREEDVSAVVRLAAASGLRIVPRGAGTGLSGGANAMARSIVLSLERMTRIVEVERRRAVRRRRGGRHQRHAARGGRRARPLVPARPRELPHLDDRRQRRDERGRHLLREVRRDPRLRARPARSCSPTATWWRSAAAPRRASPATTSPRSWSGPRARSASSPRSRCSCCRSADARSARSSARSGRCARPASRSRDHARRASCRPPSSSSTARASRRSTRGRRSACRTASTRCCSRRSTRSVRSGVELAASVARIMADAGAMSVEQAVDAAEVDRLFLARRLAYPALERLGPVLTEDICVPRGAVPEMLARIQATAAEHDVVIANIAHAGDGNLHPLIIAPEGDDAAKAQGEARVRPDRRRLPRTRRHGDGRARRRAAEAAGRARGARRRGSSRCTRRSSSALDPLGTLNPGKAFPA